MTPIGIVIIENLFFLKNDLLLFTLQTNNVNGLGFEILAMTFYKTM